MAGLLLGLVVQAGWCQTAAKYSDVITAQAKTQHGFVDIHQVGDKCYFEIPASALGKDILWAAELEKMPRDVGTLTGIALGNGLMRFERGGGRLLLRHYSLNARQGTSSMSREDQWDPAGHALAVSSFPPAIASFDVVTEGPDGSLVIDVTAVFGLDGLRDLSPVATLGVAGYATAGLDPGASYIEETGAYPRNVGVRSHLTYNLADGGETSKTSVVVYHSLTLLPDEPMKPRFHDARVGYFTVAYEDFSGVQDHGVTARQLICRFRLEKKDPSAAVSEPVKPIVYYVGRDVPEKWRPYFKQAIEDWQGPFEAAGFKNAIIAKDAPTPQEDPTWDPAHTRFSVIRWLAQPHANAMGPNTHDPRTGEILSAHVYIWSEVLSLVQQWYFTRCAMLDPRAQKLPLPDDVVGPLIRYAVAHEVGHSLGLRHNHRASQVYSIAQLRDPVFAKTHGPVASIMSYGRFNYVAQPEDGVKDLIPMISPYDDFAISWGYRPIPDAATPEDERPTLDTWAAKQMEDPFLAFGGEDRAALVDPNVLRQNIGADRIEATRLGLLNLDRTSDPDFLIAATTNRGETYERLNTAWGWLASRRMELLQSVTTLVGGVEETRTLAGRGGAQFHRVPRARQREAVQFVLERGLKDPGPLADPRLLDLVQPLDAVYPFVIVQETLLTSLLNEKTYRLLQDAVTLEPGDAYSVGELLTDVQGGVFEELHSGMVRVDPLRQALQRNYIDHLGGQLNAVPDAAGLASAGTEQWTAFRPAARASLETLLKQLEKADGKTRDEATQAHLRYCAAQIKSALK